MSQNNQEIEAKFAIRDLAPIQARLSELGAVCIVSRQMEFNLRYDAPDGHLSATGQVLRLRRYDDIRMTYKGPGLRNEGVLERTEIETTLGDFDSARQILEHLGYTPIFLYEKYRAIWQLGENQIMLDEMPFGNFVEIESPNAEGVRAPGPPIEPRPPHRHPGQLPGPVRTRQSHPTPDLQRHHLRQLRRHQYQPGRFSGRVCRGKRVNLTIAPANRLRLAGFTQ
jgi:adenylate cyclase, class 2